MRTDALFALSAAYLLLPNAVFAIGWLRPAWGYGVALALLACLADVLTRARTDAPPIGRAAWVAVAAFAAFWVVAGGIGELNVQVLDYVKHNLLFHDLAVERWPVVYRAADLGDPLLCYYVAYYLPAALAAKVAGLRFAAVASLAWGAGGVVLAFAWVVRLARQKGPGVLAAFTLVDGLCWVPGLAVLARALAGGGAPRGGWWQTDGFTERFWSFAGTPTRLMFQSEPSLLIWTPQHALAAWLATACVLTVTWERRGARHALLVNAAVLLWSPFVALGLLPFTAAALLRSRGGLGWADALGGAALAGPVGAYFLAHRPQRHLGLLFAALPDAAAWGRYALFLLLAIGVVWGAVALAQLRYALLDEARWRTFRLAGVALVVATFVHMGKYNDWAMRVSMPSLFVLHLTAATAAVALWRRRAPRAHRLAMAAVLLLAAERPLKDYVLVPLGRAGAQGEAPTIAASGASGGGLVRLRDGDDPDVASQYLGSTDSWFGRHLMKTTRAGDRGAGPAVRGAGREP